MSNNWSGQASGGSNNIKIQNFLEALRNSQKLERSGEGDSPARRNIFAEIQAKKEIEKRRVEQFQQNRNQEWNKVYSAKEIRTQKRIEEIREQLKQLGKQLKRLDNNIQKAVESPIVDYGEYQESYLEHLKHSIHLFSLKVNSANSWLEVYQSRSRKVGAYWSMARSKGSSYTQNNERNIATSVG